MTERSLRGQAVVAGIGSSTFYKHGQSPDAEFKLALKAILAACADAGIDPRTIDGFASYSNDRNDPVQLARALGIHELRYSNMQWRGGGGGVAAAVANASAALVAGLADCVVVSRALAQGQFGRFGQGADRATVTGDAALEAPYGLLTPAHKGALQTRRFMHEHGVTQNALRAVALASYHHAQANPAAVKRGKPLTGARYDASRWIVEPFHLFDYCMENDGAAAVILVSADRARDLPHPPVYVLAAAGGAGFRAGAASMNDPHYAAAGFRTIAPRLYETARLGPDDVGVVQAYENFTGGVVMALAEHGFFRPEDADAFLRLPNLLAPSGRLPLNTSGGNLAECYVHGLGHVMEGVRQVRKTSSAQAARSDVSLVIRKTSSAQAARSDVSLVIGGPLVAPASSLILGSADTL